MGCVTSSSEEKTSLNPQRLAVESDIPFPTYWAETDVTTEYRKSIQCEVAEPHEIEALQLLMDKTSLEECTRRLKIEFALRIEDSHMWDDYRRALTYISEIRGEETTDSMNLDGVIAKTKSGTMEEMPLTTRKLPELYKDRLLSKANETYLWHATPRVVAEKIVEDNFNTKKSGSANGQVLGKGVYLAESASLSDEYAVQGPGGRYCVLLCRAALGKVYATRRFSKWRGKKLVMTTFTTKLVRAGECDSVMGDRSLANRKGVREYCVANSSQIYPEYLIRYSREETKGKVVPSG